MNIHNAQTKHVSHGGKYKNLLCYITTKYGKVSIQKLIH